MGIVWFSHVTGAIPVQLITAPDLSAAEAHPGIAERLSFYSLPLNLVHYTLYLYPIYLSLAFHE